MSPSSLVLTACGSRRREGGHRHPVGVGSATVTTTVVTGGNTTERRLQHPERPVQRPRSAPCPTPRRPSTSSASRRAARTPGAPWPGPSAWPPTSTTFPTPPHTKTWLAPMTEISGPYAVDSIGTRYAQCSYVDGGGVQVLARKGFSLVDDSVAGDLPGDQPRRGRVRLVPRRRVGGLDASPRRSHRARWRRRAARTRPSPRTPSSPSLTCTATSAGGANTATLNIRRDATAPVVCPTSTLAGGGAVVNGWYTSPVGVTFTATDETSLFLVDGRAVGTSSQTVRTSGDGELDVASPAFTDRAGNSSAVGARSAPSRSTPPPRTRRARHSARRPARRAGTPPRSPSPSHPRATRAAASPPAAPPSPSRSTPRAETVSGTCTDHAGHVSAAKEVTVSSTGALPS